MLAHFFAGVVPGLSAPFQFVVVSGGWTSELLAILSLDLPLIGAYFPSRLHRYFKPKGGLTSWFVPSDVKTTVFPEGIGLLVSGSKRFIDGIIPDMGLTRQLIASVVIKLCGMSLQGLHKDRALVKELLNRHGLHPVSFPDAQNGGATDACHVIGFCGDLCLDILTTSSKGLPLTLHHFLDRGAKGSFPEMSRVPRLAIPVVADPPRTVLWHLDAVLGEGLFPCTCPRSLVYCPSHFFLQQWIRRALTLPKLLCLYQLPLSMDPLLRDLNPGWGLPFEDTPAPDLFVLIFRQLWGEYGGLVLSPVSDKTPNCGRINVEIGNVGEDLVEVEGDVDVGEDLVEVEGDGDMKEMVERAKDDRELTKTKAPATGTNPPTQSPSIMTAYTGLEMQGMESDGAEAVWKFDFGDLFVELDGGPTDKDRVTSMASEETLAWWSARGHEETLAWWSAQGEDWEPHEHGGAQYNPGPPFAVGNVIHCVVGKHGLQRTFILKSDHPCYKLRLESETTVSTSTKESWLAPRLASWADNLNDIAPDQDDPFSSITRQVKLGRSKEKQKMGLYGVHGDAQCESLCLVEEAKAFAKAVKADDAEIPIHLWNDQVNAPGIPQEKRDNALIGLRKLGFRLFRKSLLRDCSAYLASAYGADWERKPCQGKCGKRTELD